MKINEIIKERRKAQNLTQEQVAEYLGVSTPAVNKWERGISYPDITLLPALARLMKVDLNTLLSFNEDLSEQEIGHFTNELVAIIQAQGYEAGFEVAMAKIQTYPTCDQLIYMTALTLEGAVVMFAAEVDAESQKNYREKIEKLYVRVSRSDNEEIRQQAHAMLIARYMEREEYDKAQALINTLPKSPVDKMQIQAQLHARQEKYKEACELLESRLMTMANEIQSILLFMMDIAVKENQEERAAYLADTAAKTAQVYDLWAYNRYVAHLQLAMMRRDVNQSITYLKEAFAAMDSKWEINRSLLYTHIKQKEGESSFTTHLKNSILVSIQKDENSDFLRDDPRFLELVDEMNK